MNTHNGLPEILCKQFESIIKRIEALEIKVNMLALTAGLIDYCKCYQQSTDRIMIEGMPCCPTCEKVIKYLVER